MAASGRLKTLGFSGDALTEHTIDRLVERLRRA
jgi:hypothetical protein